MSKVVSLEEVIVLVQRSFVEPFYERMKTNCFIAISNTEEELISTITTDVAKKYMQLRLRQTNTNSIVLIAGIFFRAQVLELCGIFIPLSTVNKSAVLDGSNSSDLEKWFRTSVRLKSLNALHGYTNVFNAVNESFFLFENIRFLYLILHESFLDLAVHVYTKKSILSDSFKNILNEVKVLASAMYKKLQTCECAKKEILYQLFSLRAHDKFGIAVFLAFKACCNAFFRTEKTSLKTMTLSTEIMQKCFYTLMNTLTIRTISTNRLDKSLTACIDFFSDSDSNEEKEKHTTTVHMKRETVVSFLRIDSIKTTEPPHTEACSVTQPIDSCDPVFLLSSLENKMHDSLLTDENGAELNEEECWTLRPVSSTSYRVELINLAQSDEKYNVEDYLVSSSIEMIERQRIFSSLFDEY